MKILLGVAAADYIRSKTTATLFSIAKKHPDIELLIRQGCYVHKNRQDIAEHAIKENFDYLFFVDSDMCFAAEALNRLLSRDKEIIGAHYNCRSFPLRSTMKMADKDGNLVALEGEMPKEPFKVHSLGMGCMLIKVSAFEKIPKPWFWYGEPDKPSTYTGEDIWFSRQAAKAGIDTWCEPSVEAGHLGEHIF